MERKHARAVFARGRRSCGNYALNFSIITKLDGGLGFYPRAVQPLLCLNILVIVDVFLKRVKYHNEAEVVQG